MKLYELMAKRTVSKKLIEGASLLTIGVTRGGIQVHAQPPSSTSSRFQPVGGSSHVFRVGGKIITINTTDIDWEGDEGFIWETIKSDVMEQLPNGEVAEIIATYMIGGQE